MVEINAITVLVLASTFLAGTIATFIWLVFKIDRELNKALNALKKLNEERIKHDMLKCINPTCQRRPTGNNIDERV